MARTGDSVIHDLGYQRYTGVRLGRSHAVLALYLRSLRSGFGLGHGPKAKIFPWAMVGIIGMVATIIAAISSTSGTDLVSYAEFCDTINTVTVLLAASVASEVISKDLGVGVLPLYFARPLTRTDYALAKLGAVVTALALVLWTAQLLIFAGAALSSEDGMSSMLGEIGQLSGGLTTAALHALVIGSIAAVASSLCGRRLFAAVAVVAVFLVTTPVAAIVEVLGSTRLAGLISPLGMLSGVSEWLFSGTGDPGSYGPVYGVGIVLVIACATLGLVVRYRTVKA